MPQLVPRGRAIGSGGSRRAGQGLPGAELACRAQASEAPAGVTWVARNGATCRRNPDPPPATPNETLPGRGWCIIKRGTTQGSAGRLRKSGLLEEASGSMFSASRRSTAGVLAGRRRRCSARVARAAACVADRADQPGGHPGRDLDRAAPRARDASPARPRWRVDQSPVYSTSAARWYPMISGSM